MLDDLIALDLSGLEGQFTGRILADLGMRVIKVEPPGGDPVRGIGPFKDDVPGPGASLRHAFLAAGKESVTLDIETDDGRAMLLALAGQVDVLIESYPPGHLARRGLDPEALMGRNPRLVVASVTGFGQTGPRASFAATDIVAVATGGLMHISGDPALPPVRPPETQGYYYACVFAAYGVLLALYERGADGPGRAIDVSMQESVATQEHMIREAAYDGVAITRNGSQHKHTAPANIFPCADGHVFLFILGARDWSRLLEIWPDHPPELDAKELLPPHRRREHVDLINPLVEEFTRRYSKRELTTLLQEAGIPCLPVNSPSDFLAEEQVRARDFLGEVESAALGRYEMPRFPALFDGRRPPPAAPPPRAGEHDAEIYGGRLGLSAADLELLAARGVNPMASFLNGVRVVSLSTGIAGPNAARMLANYGAEVLKVESRAGGLDAFRSYGDDPEASPRFVEVNLNTRSVTINLKHSEGVALVTELAAVSDVVMDNFRPGVMERLGLGPDVLYAANHKLIVVRMPGLGSTGPLSAYGTWGPTLTAYSGLTYLWNHPGQERPVGSQGVYPDYLTGEMVPIAVVAALIERRRTGRGTVIDVAQVDLAAYMLGTTLLDVLVNDRPAEPVGNHSGHMAPHGCYRCRGDDRWCVIAVADDGQWRALCQTIGRPSLAEDPRFATFTQRARRRDELDGLIAEWTQAHDPFEVMEALQAVGVAAGVVQSGADLAADPHLAARGFIETVHHPVLGEVPMAGLPLHFSSGGHEPFRPPPPLGADNEYVVTELLGRDRAEFERLEREQIVY